MVNKSYYAVGDDVLDVSNHKAKKNLPSPAKPALHIPDPLSITNAWTSSPSIAYIV
jgi:hypothetical protein